MDSSALRSKFGGLYAIVFICIVSPTSVGASNSDLPGLLSSMVCDDATINETLHVAPVCVCRQMFGITDLGILCSSYQEFANCVEEHVHRMKNFSNGFVSLLYGKGRFLQSMKYICHKKEDADKVSSCGSSATCDKMLQTYVGRYVNQQINESTACNLAAELSKCYWQRLDSCPTAQRHLWTKLADSYMSWTCTKYDIAEHKLCQSLWTEYQRDHNLGKKKLCLAKVEFERDCLVLERLGSLDSGDQWENREFEMDRYVDFARFKCEIKHEREQGCTRNVGQCGLIFRTGYERQLQIMETNQSVSTADICSLYEDFTACVKNNTHDCPVFRIYHESSFCGIMPASCTCHLDLEEEKRKFRATHPPNNNNHGPIANSSTSGFSTVLPKLTILMMCFLHAVQII